MNQNNKLKNEEKPQTENAHQKKLSPQEKLRQRGAANNISDIEARAHNDFDKLTQDPDAPKTTLPVGLLDPNPYQPRRAFNQEKLEELAENLREVGQIQPIAVRFHEGRYQIIAGERRFRATMINGKKVINASIFEVSDRMMASMALSENIQREDLSDYEIALYINSLDQFFDSKAEIAQQMNKNRTDLYKYLNFFKLPHWILSLLDNNEFLFGRSIATSLATLFNSAKYIENNTGYDEAIKNALKKLAADALTPSMFMNEVERTVRDAKTTRKTSLEAVKSHFHVDGKKIGSFVSDARGVSIKIDYSVMSTDTAKEISDYIAEKLSAKQIFPKQTSES